MSLYEDHARRQGAAASRRQSDSPAFRLWVRLRREDPGASFGVVMRKFREQLERNPEVMDDVVLYVATNFDNASRADIPEPKTKKQRQKESEEIAEEAKGQARQIVEAIQIKTLKSFLLPNGKLAWDATCGELRSYSGFLGAISRLGKPNDVVSSLPLSKLKKINTPQ